MTSHSHPLPAFIYRPDIDGLRAFAVLVAVLFHAYGPAMPGGYTGADIFFVISGYLITGIILRDAEKGRFHIGDFYVRRCRRIIPALAATLTFCLAAGWQLLWVDDYRYLLRNTFTSALFYQNIFLWQHTDYFAPAAKFHPLLHLWSLGVEEQFYLLWPGLLWLALRWRWNISRLIAALLLLSFTFCLWVVRHDHMAAYYLLPSRFWELAIGGLLAAYRPRLSLSPRVAAVASATGMLMLCASMVVMVAGMPYPSAWALLPTLGTTLVIAAGPQAWLNRCLLSSRPAVFIGLISYPLYLWHWALLALVRINWGEEAPTPWIVGAVACSFLLSVLTYYGLETPARRQTSPQRARAIALGLLAWLAALAIISHANRAGFPAGYAEHPKLQRQYDYNADFRSHHCDLEWGDAITLRPDCIEPDFKKRGNTSLLLWGDSFAAHLYRGLLALKQEAPELRLAQYNKTGCPPLLVEHDIDGCLTFNKAVLAWIGQEKPNIVLLAANWQKYTPEEIKALTPTVAALKKAGVPRIVMMGMVPVWRTHLPRLAYQYMRLNRTALPPQRMHMGLLPGVPPFDMGLKSYAKSLGAEYLSPFDYLCNAEGCLVTVDAAREEFTAWDYAHLSQAGAQFLIHAVAAELLGKKQK